MLAYQRFGYISGFALCDEICSVRAICYFCKRYVFLYL